MIIIDEVYNLIVEKLKDEVEHISINSSPELLDDTLVVLNTSDIKEDKDLDGYITKVSTELTLDYIGSSEFLDDDPYTSVRKSEEKINKLKEILVSLREELSNGLHVEFSTITRPKQEGIVNAQLPLFRFVVALNIN